MRKIVRSLLLALMAFALVSSTVLAAWEYLFPVVVVDTSNTTRPYLPIILGFNGQTLVDADKISASGNDTNMQIGSSSIKYMMSTTHVTAVIPSLPSGGMATADFYTGYSPEQSGFPIITGSGGYVTVSDNASMEPSNNFTLSMSGYLDATKVGANLTSKQYALRIYIPSAGTVNATMGVPSGTEFALPNGVGDFTNIASCFPGGGEAHWEDVDDPVGASDNDTSYVFTDNVVGQSDAYALQNAPPGSVANVTVHYRVKGDNVALQARPSLRLGGVTQLGTAVFTPLVWTDFSENITRPGGGVWQAADLADLQVVLYLAGGGFPLNAYCTQIYVEVTYDQPVWITVSSVSSGVSTVSVSSNTTHLILNVGGSSNSTALGGMTVPDNTNNFVFGRGDAMPYTDNITLSVNGTQELYLAPLVMLSGANIPDRSGNSHNGTITWGNNTGLSILYGEMSSYEDYYATANITAGFTMPEVAMPSTWFAGGESASSLPLYDFFSSMASQSGMPVQTLYFLGIVGLAFGAFLAVIIFTRSALMACVALVAVLGIGSTMTIVPAWIVFALIVVLAGILYLYKQFAY